MASYDIYVTRKLIAGKTLQQIVETIDETRGVMFRGITRAGRSLPIGLNVIVERGDTLQVTGSEDV